jgi:hypothetical protein
MTTSQDHTSQSRPYPDFPTRPAHDPSRAITDCPPQAAYLAPRATPYPTARAASSLTDPTTPPSSRPHHACPTSLADPRRPTTVDTTTHPSSVLPNPTSLPSPPQRLPRHTRLTPTRPSCPHLSDYPALPASTRPLPTSQPGPPPRRPGPNPTAPPRSTPAFPSRRSGPTQPIPNPTSQPSPRRLWPYLHRLPRSRPTRRDPDNPIQATPPPSRSRPAPTRQAIAALPKTVPTPQPNPTSRVSAPHVQPTRLTKPPAPSPNLPCSTTPD